MNENNKPYIPALKYTWLTSLYDPIIGLTMREFSFKQRMIEQADIRMNQRVLDVGCGTATLAILLKRMHPNIAIVGIDGDSDVLNIARKKAAKASLDITLELGIAFELPCATNYFDHVFSSLLFHHLTTENKRRTLKEIFRVLKPEGELHVADFGKPKNKLMYFISIFMRRLEKTEANFRGLLPQMLEEAGFDRITEYAQYMTVFSSISLYEAVKPAIDNQPTRQHC